MKTRFILAVSCRLLLSCLLTLMATVSSFATEPPARPNDPLFPQQKALFERLSVLEAWEITKGDPGVIVGVIDTGFDFFHPDLQGQVLPGYYGPQGYHPEIAELLGHGTIVSSIIAAKDDNGIGMAGLAPNCRVLGASLGTIEHTVRRLQLAWQDAHPGKEPTVQDMQQEIAKHRDTIRTFSLAWAEYQSARIGEAARYLADHGAKVINFSGGGMPRKALPPEAWTRIDDAFTYAASKDVVLVVAAGNNAMELNDYPGPADQRLVAGAAFLNDTRWEQKNFGGSGMTQGSNFGQQLSVMAPVENIQVCVPHEARFYRTESGALGPVTSEFKDAYEVLQDGATSAAAPVVASLAALVRSIRPDLDARSVVKIIKQGCDDIGDEGFDIHTGHGRVNFLKTLKAAQAWRAVTSGT